MKLRKRLLQLKKMRLGGVIECLGELKCALLPYTREGNTYHAVFFAVRSCRSLPLVDTYSTHICDRQGISSVPRTICPGGDEQWFGGKCNNNQPLSLNPNYLFSPTHPFFVREYEGPSAVIPLANKMDQDGLVKCQLSLRASEEMREKYEASNKETLQRTKKRKSDAISDSQGDPSQVCLLSDGTQEDGDDEDDDDEDDDDEDDDDVSNLMKPRTKQGVESPITSHANFPVCLPRLPRKEAFGEMSVL